MKIQEERLMKAAILGYGTVGSGVYEVLQRNAEVIAEKSGENIEVKYVLDLREFPGDPVMEVLVHDYECIVNDPEVRIVVETMGGVKPAYEFVRRALECGKHVCTSNKELVAEYGAELLALAKERAVNFYFEASVGGGIPIIRPLCECLAADKILEISGILNGTTNYILTRMYNEGADFNCVLRKRRNADMRNAIRRRILRASMPDGSLRSWPRLCWASEWSSGTLLRKGLRELRQGISGMQGPCRRRSS